MNEERKICAYDADKGDIYGWCVSICTDYMIVGSLYNDDNGFSSGSVYLYENPMASGGGGESFSGEGLVPSAYLPTATVISGSSSEIQDVHVLFTPTPTVTPTPVVTYTPTPVVKRNENTVQQ